jgi:hypothetical protein
VARGSMSGTSPPDAKSARTACQHAAPRKCWQTAQSAGAPERSRTSDPPLRRCKHGVRPHPSMSFHTWRPGKTSRAEMARQRRTVVRTVVTANGDTRSQRTASGPCEPKATNPG